MDLIRAQMFGDFTLSCGETAVSDQTGRSYRVWQMIAYLVYHRDRMVALGELIHLFGNSEKSVEPVNAFRVMVTKARRLLKPLGPSLILCKGGAYGWNPTVPLELDTEVFEAHCQAAGSGSEEDRLSHFRQAVQQYRGEFLEKYAQEAWREPAAVYYHRLYIELLEGFIPLLEGEEAFQEITSRCQEALRFDPYHEPLYRHAMRALIHLGDLKGAKAVYEQMRERWNQDLGIEPEEETRRLYEEAALGLRRSPSVSLDFIRGLLREQDAPTRALLCDFQTFKLYYQAEARTASRRGDAIHIGVLTVEGKEGPLSEKRMERAMEQLRDIILGSLRIGDVVSRCSRAQYVVMLIHATFEDSRMVCQRLCRLFAQAHSRSPAQVHSAVLPLEPYFDFSAKPNLSWQNDQKEQ